MKKTLTILLLFISLTAFALEQAETIFIENEKINIPPSGSLTKVNNSMPEILERLEAVNPPGLEAIRYYIPEEDAIAFFQGEEINIRKILALKYTPEISDINIDKKMFDAFKQKIKKQSLKALLEKEKDNINTFILEAQKDLSVNERGFLALTEDPFIDEAPIIETSDTLTLSITTSYQEGQSTYNNFVQMTYVHVNNKMLVLYASAPQSQKSWATKNSRNFIRKLLELNPPYPVQENKLYTKENAERIIDAGIGGAIGPIVIIAVFFLLQGLLYLIKKAINK